MFTSISLRDVAEKAGVSRSTASRALQHHPMVALKTRERVEAVAEELGYQPDQVVSGLMRRNRSHREQTPQHTRIAWINPLKEERAWHDIPYHRASREMAGERAKRLNMEIEDIWLGQPGMKAARLEQILYSRGIHGAILAHPNRPVEDYGFKLDHLALVVLGGHPMHRAKLTQVLPDEFGNLMLAMEHLRNRGYQRIAFCTNDFINWTSELRLEAAYRQAQQELKAKDRLPVIHLKDDVSAPMLLKSIDKLKPDALISLWGDTRDWLEEHGISIPDDMGLISLNLTEHTPDWSGITQNQPAKASAAVDAVTAQLARFDLGYTASAKRILIDGDWVDGNTTR